MPIVDAPGGVAASRRFMTLQPVRFWMRRSAHRFRPSGDHIRAYMPNAGQSVVTFDMQRTQESLPYRLSFIKSGLVWHVQHHCSARRQAFGAETDSAANQFGAHVTERRKPRAAHFRCSWPVSAPRILAESASETDYEKL